MNEQLLTAFAVLFVFVFSIVTALAIFWLANRLLVGKPMTNEQMVEYECRFQKRLLQPKWDELCSHYGFEMPRALRDLYTNRSVLTRSDFYVQPPDAPDQDEHHFIASFQPADSETILNTWFPIGENGFPFAVDDFGNYYFVQLSPESDDPPVFYVDHDGGDISPVCDSLSTFLNWPTYIQR